MVADDEDLMERFTRASSYGLLPAFFEELPEDDADSLATQHPDVIGPSDGVPVALRYVANRLLVEQCLEAATTAGNAQLAYNLASLDRYAGQFLLIETQGRGQVIEVLGDLERASYVAVVIPGMGATLENFNTAVRAKAVNLQASIFRTEPDLDPAEVCVVAWLGYQAPGLQDVRYVNGAFQAGPILKRFINLTVASETQTVVALGHSYGSVVLGVAAREPLQVRRVIASGSPGMTVDSVDGFALGSAARVFAVANRLDTIAHLGWFGTPPHRAKFGATRLRGNGSINPYRAHSTYFDHPSWACGSQAAATLGHYD
jgi:hypothetical protein